MVFIFEHFFRALKAMFSKDGGAGAIRDAGGAFGAREKAQEDQYFRKLVFTYLTFL